MRPFNHTQERLTPGQKALELALAPPEPSITYDEALQRIRRMGLTAPQCAEMTLSVALRFKRPHHEINGLLTDFESHSPPIFACCTLLWRVATMYPDLAVPAFARVLAALRAYLPTATHQQKIASAAFLRDLIARDLDPETTRLATEALTLAA